MTSLRLRKLYRLAGWMTAIGCLLLGGVLFMANLEAYQRDRTAARELERFHLALVVANLVSAERGPANSRIGAAPDAQVRLDADLGAARRHSDNAISAFESFARRTSSDADSELALMARVRMALASGRAAVDAISAELLAQRDSARVRDAIEKMFAAADVAAALRDDLGGDIIRDYPQAGNEVLLSTICSNLREYAGRLGSYVVMMLASSGAPDRELHDRITATEGRLTELRALVSSYAGTLIDDAAVRAALDDVDRKYFGEALPFARQVADNIALMSGRLSLAEFTADYVPGMKPVETLRELIGQASHQRVAQARDHAQKMLALTAALMLSVWSVLILIGAALHYLLFVPLMAAREQIVAIAQGVLTEPEGERRQGSEEMQELFDSLDVLRQQQRLQKDLELDQERMAAKLKRLSETDPLTGLLNRRALEAVGRRAVAEADRSGRSLALIMFDIDYFKSINDTYGHGVGDVVLKCVATTVQARLRPGTSFARHGGEEFVVLVQASRDDEGRLIAERLRTALRLMAVPDVPPTLSVTASFGVSLYRPGQMSWDALVAEADQRLYLAKRLGRNRVCTESDDETATSPKGDRLAS